MLGPEGRRVADSEIGLMPRMIQHLFRRMAAMSETQDCVFKVFCSFLGIYNEKLNDLLLNISSHATDYQRKQSIRPLSIRENFRTGMYIDNLSKKRVHTVQDCLNYLQAGALLRKSGSTMMNKTSSRSHAVFTLEIEYKRKDKMTTIKKSKLHLIDLAGSERQLYTKSTGQRLREACSINQSLSHLGKVIMALAEKSRGKQVHVHYRDSKLTYLLKDSLGGNSKTIIIANISPSFTQAAETLSTLEFAKRAKRIKNKPMVNLKVKGSTALLEREVKRLRQQVSYLSNMMRKGGSGMSLAQSGTFTKEQLSNPFFSLIRGGKNELPEAKIQRLESLLLRGFARIEKFEQIKEGHNMNLEKLKNIIEGKENLFQVCRMLLKIREVQLAKLLKRPPMVNFLRRKVVSHVEITDIDVVKKYGPLDDQELEDRKREMQVDIIMKGEKEPEDSIEILNGEGYEDHTLGRIEEIEKRIFHMDQNPTVQLFAYQNIVLQDQLRKFNENGIGEDYLCYLDSMVKEYEHDFEQLLSSKRSVMEDIKRNDTLQKENDALKEDMSKVQAIENENAMLKAQLAKFQETDRFVEQREMEFEIILQQEKRQVEVLTRENNELLEAQAEDRRSFSATEEKYACEMQEMQEMFSTLMGISATQQDERERDRRATDGKLDNVRQKYTTQMNEMQQQHHVKEKNLKDKVKLGAQFDREFFIQRIATVEMTMKEYEAKWKMADGVAREKYLECTKLTADLEVSRRDTIHAQEERMELSSKFNAEKQENFELREALETARSEVEVSDLTVETERSLTLQIESLRKKLRSFEIKMTQGRNAKAKVTRQFKEKVAENEELQKKVRKLQGLAANLAKMGQENRKLSSRMAKGGGRRASWHATKSTNNPFIKKKGSNA